MASKLKLKSKSLNFLPKPATPANFLNPPTSPVRSPVRREYKIIPLVPKEARRRSKSGSFDWREPTSPKVSCMGQVSRRKKTKTKLASPKKPNFPAFSSPRKQITMIGKILKWSKTDRKCEDKAGVSSPPQEIIVSAPPLGQMKQFESGRGGALHCFDWKNTVPNLAASVDGKVVAAEARKEVNLWRRRSMAPPTALRI